MVFIYVLKDPRDLKVKYVGKTVLSIKTHGLYFKYAE